jgi:hypothetical protein
MKVAAVKTRRALLATALAGAAEPRLGFAQVQPERAIMKIECAFSDHIFAASLYDNPSARDLASMLPFKPDDRRLLQQREDLTSAAQAYRGGKRPLHE